MQTLGNISRYIQAASIRLDDLSTRARTVKDEGRPIVQESLLHLASTLEELRVSEEELRSQADGLAACRDALESELRLYRSLFNESPDAYLLTDPDGVIRQANRAAAAMLGFREEYLAGQPLLVFVHEEDRRDFRRRLPWIRETERVAGWGFRLVNRQGDTLGLEAAVSALHAGAGGEPGLRWTLREADPAAPETAAPRKPVPLVENRDAAGRHPAADAAWCDTLLSEAERTVDPSSRAAAEQLAGLFRDSLALALYVGLIRPGDRIPGIREVSRATRLNHKTVARAYRALEQEGALEVRDRSGVYVARQGWTDRHPAGETEEWAAEVLTEAWQRKLAITALPELVRRWTAAASLRCACVEADAARRATLCAELREAFGVECVPLASAAADDERAVADLARVIGEVDFVVTTPFHAGRLRTLVRALGKPLVVVTARPNPGVVAAEGTPLPELTAEIARSISETVVLLNLERARNVASQLTVRTL